MIMKTQCQNLWDVSKAGLREKFITLKAYITKIKKPKFLP